jgi:lipoprotein-releasing system ATP-binding protein
MSDELEQILGQPAASLRPTPVASPVASRPSQEVISRPKFACREGDRNGCPTGSQPALRLAASEQSASAEDHLLTIDLHKSYRKGAIEVPVLRGVSMSVERGEFLAIVGQSGSGKSTLLHLLGTLDAPDQGEVYYAGGRIDNQPAAARDTLRNRQFGMIFQFYHLLPELSTLENVLAPLMIAEGVWSYLRHRREHRARAEALLEMVGLSHRLKHCPRELSGGEMQRAAIARALVAEPDLVLADEPTGNLDQATGQEIIRILRTLNQQRNLTIVMVTHDRAIADQADRIVRLANGRIEE